MGTNEPDCPCVRGEFRAQALKTRFIGVDDHHGEVTVRTCRTCGRHWVHYLYENESVSRSGRWFCGLVDDAKLSTLRPGNALEILQSLEWYYRGGSFFGGSVTRGSGRIRLYP